MKFNIANDILVDVIEALGYEVPNSGARERIYVRLIEIFEEAGANNFSECQKYDKAFKKAFKETQPEEIEFENV